MKTKIVLQYCFILIFSIFANPVLAQVSSGGIPYSFSDKNSSIMRSSSGNPEVNSFQIEDLDREEINRELERFNKDCKTCRNDSYYGKEIDMNIDFFEKAKSYDLPEGDKIWLFNIHSKSAEGYQFVFDNFQIPRGGKLFIYNEDKSMYLGSFTSLNNREDNRFITQYVNGNSIYIEYFEPKEEKGNTKINIEKVVYIFDDCFSRKGIYSKDGADDCHINTACYEFQYEIEIKSTVLILEKVNDKYWGFCSGVLLGWNVNDLSEESTRKLKLLSANHCYEDDDGNERKVSDWVFLFRHESPSCSGSDGLASTTKSVVGAKVLSNDKGSQHSDWLLLELNTVLSEIWDYDI
jgi:hypothetical protein